MSLEDGKWKSTRGPDLIMERYFHACNSFTFNNELILAVVGGSTLSGSNFNEFLSYDSEDPQAQWDNRDTELDLPFDDDYYSQLLVSNGDTLFYVDTWNNVFYRLEWNFEEGFEWIQMNLRLKARRELAFGVLIPDELTVCNKTAFEFKDAD